MYRISPLRLLQSIESLVGVSVRKRPDSACIQVTSRCNLQCRFCNFWQDPKDLDVQTALELIAELSELGVKSLGLTGGEPTLHRGLWEMIDYAKSRRMYVGVNTNGLTLKGEVIDRIEESGLDLLQVSLDGLAVAHDRIRNMEGCFDLVVDNLKNLKDCHCRKEIAAVITRENMRDLVQLEQFAIDLDYSFSLTLVSPYADQGAQFTGDDIELLRVLDEFQLPRSKKAVASILDALKGKPRTCFLPYSRYTIRYDRSLAPCAFVNGIGDLEKDSIRGIFGSREYKSLMRSCYRRELPACRGCYIWATR